MECDGPHRDHQVMPLGHGRGGQGHILEIAAGRGVGDGGGTEHSGRVKRCGAEGTCAAGWAAMEIKQCRIPVAIGIALKSNKGVLRTEGSIKTKKENRLCFKAVETNAALKTDLQVFVLLLELGAPRCLKRVLRPSCLATARTLRFILIAYIVLATCLRLRGDGLC